MYLRYPLGPLAVFMALAWSPHVIAADEQLPKADRILDKFVEATGEAGDVYLLHPYILHAKSQNVLRLPRIITNPPLTLAE